jgi:hypothetical protein
VGTEERSFRERLRRRHRPDRVRLLFVGEAPPASGFFYCRDSGLYRAVRDAFCALRPSVTDDGFLEAFKNAGCYLIDLCPDPVDRLAPAARREACLKSEVLLCRAIGKLQPQLIATVVRSIRGNVARAISCAGWQGPVIDLPYPGRWSGHCGIFLEKVVPVLGALQTLPDRRYSQSGGMDSCAN